MAVLRWEPLRRPSSAWHMGCKKGSDPTGASAWCAAVGAMHTQVAVRAWQEAFRNLGGGKGNKQELGLSVRLSWGITKVQMEKWVKVEAADVLCIPSREAES